MIDLSATFAGLVRHHIATPACPLPHLAPGITWIVGSNGVFKRGVNAQLDLLAAVELFEQPIPGLAALMTHVRWFDWPHRLAGSLLGPLLSNAREALAGQTIVRPIEKQYFFVLRDGLRVVAPRDQDGSPASLRYAMPQGQVLLDLHSHHAMRAYFSATDDRDDSGLSVSAVIGNIYERPEIVVRVNVFGHHWPIPALMVFDSLGPFVDRYAGGSRESTDD